MDPIADIDNDGVVDIADGATLAFYYRTKRIAGLTFPPSVTIRGGFPPFANRGETAFD